MNTPNFRRWGAARRQQELLAAINAAADRVIAAQRQQGATMAITEAQILQKVQNQTTVIAGVETLLQALSQMVREGQANNDPAMFQQISDLLDSNTSGLAQAVIDNTPAAASPSSGSATGNTGSTGPAAGGGTGSTGPADPAPATGATAQS